MASRYMPTKLKQELLILDVLDRDSSAICLDSY